MLLKETYKEKVVPELQKRLALKNRMQVPRLEKIILNMGFDAAMDKDVMKVLTQELAMISGQKPVVTKSRKSISNFKIRQGMNVGAKVTLRGPRMYDFLERLVHLTLPRIRDFRGVPARGFDSRGNYSMGLTEQTIFPEIDPDSVKTVQGMNITIVTSARSDEHCKQLLAMLGMPFAGNDKQA
ncbi:MAG: 50S ribosomal protein L5 [Kiritimatiellia bacterium]